MALSEKWVLEKARALLWNPDYTGFNPVAFARAIEAEVRKQDNELILMLVERLERADKISGYPNNKAAIAAAHARLESKP